MKFEKVADSAQSHALSLQMLLRDPTLYIFTTDL